MQYLVEGVQLSKVSGNPISLLYEAKVETVSPSIAQIQDKRSLVVVLPSDPVIAITIRLVNLLRTCAAR